MVAATALLAVGLSAVALSAAGVLLVRDPYQRLHFLAPATLFGATAITAAVMIGDPHPGRSTVKFALILAILLVSNPVVTMATGRARTEVDHLFDVDDQ